MSSRPSRKFQGPRKSRKLTPELAAFVLAHRGIRPEDLTPRIQEAFGYTISPGLIYRVWNGAYARIPKMEPAPEPVALKTRTSSPRLHMGLAERDRYPVGSSVSVEVLPGPSPEDTRRLRLRQAGLRETDCPSCGGKAHVEPPVTVTLPDGTQEIREVLRCRACAAEQAGKCADCGVKLGFRQGRRCLDCRMARKASGSLQERFETPDALPPARGLRKARRCPARILAMGFARPPPRQTGDPGCGPRAVSLRGVALAEQRPAHSDVSL